MKNKSIGIVIIILLLLMLAMFSGATMFSGKTQISLYYEGKKLLDKEYKIKTSTLMNVIFKNKADFYKFYKSNRKNPHVRNFSCINDEIQNDLLLVKKQVEYDSMDSQLIWDKEKAEFEIVDGINGKVVNQNEFIESLYKNFGKETKVEIPTEEIPQKITRENLEKRSMERGRFSTSFKTSSLNRKHNIEIASNRLNGMRIEAGEVLSFNGVVGPRTVANGFLQSRIISGGVFVSGVGGGVCQVSTTLFNAWIRAGLEVIEAKNHSLKVSYVPPSMDAMVSSKTDLTLRNNTDYDVFLKSFIEDDNIHIIIYGYELKEKIVIRNEVVKILYCDEYEEIKKEDIEWKEGERFRILSHPKNGLVSNAYKDVYEGGRLVSSTKIRTNTYLCQKGKIVKRDDEEEKNQEENQDKSSIKFSDFNTFSGIFERIPLLKDLVS